MILRQVTTRSLWIASFLPFTRAVPQDSRTPIVPLLIASVVGLLACPQLLKDEFGSSIDPNQLTCARATGCEVAGASSGSSGAGGSETNVGGTATGVGGSVSTAGGTSEAPDASAPVEPPVVLITDASPGPDCWVVALNDSTQSLDDNCLGVYGWNAVETDPDADTEVTLSYQDGAVCFDGAIVAETESWGAVFNLTLADGASWNAQALGVGGFQLEALGPSLPPRVEVIYTSGGSDYCRVITPAAAVPVPFDTTHPGCDTGAGLPAPNASVVSFLRLHLPIASDDYALDFCLRIRAIP